MARHTVKELETMVANLQEILDEKNKALTRMANDKVEIRQNFTVVTQQLSSARSERNYSQADVTEGLRKIASAETALNTIQATLISSSAPNGTELIPECIHDKQEERIIQIITHLRFVLGIS